MDTIMRQIHQDVYKLLIDKHQKDTDFTFTFRKNNFKNRLSDGYWFYGNDWYLAVSFWSGMDWKNKTPNIIFRISKSGNTTLEFTAKDSRNKFTTIDNSIIPKLNSVERLKNKFIKNYTTFQNDYMSSLKSFLSNDKKIIDSALSEYLEKFPFEQTSENALGFIRREEFYNRWEKVKVFIREIKISRILGPRICLNSFHIKNYFPIIDVKIQDIPSRTKWIFFTGLNGTGKTAILKALTAAFCNNSDETNQIISNEEFQMEISLRNDEVVQNFKFKNSNYKYNPDLILPGFAAYGAMRQNLNESGSNRDELSSTTRGLFKNDGLLLDLSQQLRNWTLNNSYMKDVFPDAEERIIQIQELLPEIIESLVSVKLPYTSENNSDKTLYVEEDENENELPPVEFNHLASGLKSMVAMFGDMLLRLSAQQPAITDPTQLKGIVIIDEIDVHLHPIYQKKLVQILTDTFQDIQFIASTHSPIPLLGAPKKSVFFNVSRTAQEGVNITRIESNEIPTLLPNSLLTSPLFNMGSLISSAQDNYKKVRTEDDWKEIKENDEIKKSIQELINRMRK